MPQTSSFPWVLYLLISSLFLMVFFLSLNYIFSFGLSFSETRSNLSTFKFLL